jgi:hypothetical protein
MAAFMWQATRTDEDAWEPHPTSFGCSQWPPAGTLYLPVRKSTSLSMIVPIFSLAISLPLHWQRERKRGLHRWALIYDTKRPSATNEWSSSRLQTSLIMPQASCGVSRMSRPSVFVGSHAFRLWPTAGTHSVGFSTKLDQVDCNVIRGADQISVKLACSLQE